MSIDELFKDILPIIEKAAPLLCSSLNSPAVKIACGVLAVIANANANDHHQIAKNLSNDPDLFTKLANLESTHGEWLNYLDKL